MTNDEAIQWCSENNARMSFTSGSPSYVQVFIKIPLPSTPIPVWSSKIRPTLVEAVEALQRDVSDVSSGAKKPGDPSLVDLQRPAQTPSVDPAVIPVPVSQDVVAPSPVGNSG